jgi:hypothetical protein
MRSTMVTMATVALTALLSSCGGGSTDTVTVTGGGSGTPSSGTVSTQQQLADFLSRVQPLRDDANSHVDTISATLKALNTSDQTTWPAAADTITQQDKAIAADGSRLAAVQPPAAIAAAFQSYVSLYSDQARILDMMAQDLADKNTASIAGWPSGPEAQLQQNAKRTTAFKTAVIAYAARIGAPVPAWIRNTGR